MSDKTKDGCTLLGLLGAAYAIIKNNLGEFDEIFGKCHTGPLHRFVNDCEDIVEPLKDEIREWENKEDEE